MEQYGCMNEGSLYPYFLLRYRIWKMAKEKDLYLEDMMYQVEFIMSELNIPLKEGRFKYKGIEMLAGFSLENSIQNIMETWNFEQSIQTVTTDKGIVFRKEEYVEKEWKKIKRKAINRAKSFKNSSAYTYYLQYHALMELNRVFHTTPSTPTFIEGVDYPDDHHHLKRIMEEEVIPHIHYSEMVRTDTKTITERDLEKYLINHLGKIEHGLRYIGHQQTIPEGRIDLLAIDRNKTYVIIELKVSDDKELIWQAIYYPEMIKRKYNVYNVRMITLAPSYPSSILIPLKQLPHVEIKTYTPLVKLGTIEDVVIKDVPN